MILIKRWGTYKIYGIENINVPVFIIGIRLTTNFHSIKIFVKIKLQIRYIFNIFNEFLTLSYYNKLKIKCI